MMSLEERLARCELAAAARLLAIVIAHREERGEALATVAELEEAGVIVVSRGRQGLEPTASSYRLERDVTGYTAGGDA